MKKVLVLPGTIWQVPLMKKIKDMGNELHVVNPTRIKEVNELADYFFQSDIFDKDRIIGYCKNEGIDVVMSEECDIATDIVAIYNKKIGARSLPMHLAELFTNKFAMREFCSKNNFNPVPHKLCKTFKEAVSFFEENGKSVLKPLDSNASHGVFTVDSINDIQDNFKEAMSFSRHAQAVLMEKYIDGTEFTVDGIMTIHGHETLAISEKDHYKHNKNVANSLFFTQKNKLFDYDLLRKTNNMLLNATKLPFGLTHVEYKFYEGKFYLIEMAARGGGNLISATIVPYMSGIDNYNELVNSYINKEYIVNVKPDINNDRTAILKFLDLPCSGGVVKSIEGLETLSSEEDIKSFKLNFKVGDFIREPENDSVRIGYYIICSETREKFERVSALVEQKLKVILE